MNELIGYHPAVSAPRQGKRGVVVAGTALSGLTANLWNFSENLASFEYDGQFDIVHATDIISLPAACGLARKFGAAVTVDFNEFPLLEHRNGGAFANMSQANRKFLTAWIREHLNAIEGAISYSRAIARIAYKAYRVSSLPIRNLHEPLTFAFTDDAIRSEWDLPADARILVHVCTFARAYDSLLMIDIMRRLAPRYHLVLVGSANNETFCKEFADAVDDAGLADRIHLKGEIKELIPYLSYLHGADLALVILRPSDPNSRFGFSNRIADLLAARRPIVSSSFVETNRIIKRYDIGEIVPRNDAQLFADAIERHFSRPAEELARISRCFDEIAGIYNWQSEASRFIDLLDGLADRNGAGPRKNIAMVFPRGLLRNRRVLRLGNFLATHGYNVVLFVGHAPPPSLVNLYPEINIVTLPIAHVIRTELLAERIWNARDRELQKELRRRQQRREGLEQEATALAVDHRRRLEGLLELQLRSRRALRMRYVRDARSIRARRAASRPSGFGLLLYRISGIALIDRAITRNRDKLRRASYQARVAELTDRQQRARAALERRHAAAAETVQRRLGAARLAEQRQRRRLEIERSPS